MDTPFDRRVPLPPHFRRPQKTKFPLGLPALTTRSFNRLLYLTIGSMVCCAAYWYNMGRNSTNSTTEMYMRQHNITGDVEEARTILHQLEVRLAQTRTNTTIPGITAALNESADALSAASSFVACHNRLVIRFAKGDDFGAVCDTLFEGVLGCQYHFTRFHEHHRRFVVNCKIDIIKELEGEIGRIGAWDHQHAIQMTKAKVPTFALWGRLRDAMITRKVHKDGGEADDKLQTRLATELKKDLGAFSDRLQGLRLADANTELQRQSVQTSYSRVLQPLTTVGCGQSNSLCMCESIDLEAVKRLHEEAASELSQLMLVAYSVPHHIYRTLHHSFSKFSVEIEVIEVLTCE